MPRTSLGNAIGIRTNLAMGLEGLILLSPASLVDAYFFHYRKICTADVNSLKVDWTRGKWTVWPWQ